MQSSQGERVMELRANDERRIVSRSGPQAPARRVAVGRWGCLALFATVFHGQLVIVGGQSAALNRPPPGPSAVIRGVVVDGVTGAPIRRAAVSLVIEQPDRESSRVIATTADGAGQFEITGVPAARVQVTASRTGYFDYDNLWNGEPEEPQWQTVGPGQRIQGVRSSADGW
jgi:hypothetical protein